MKQAAFAIYVAFLVIFVVSTLGGAVNEIGHFVADKHQQMCVEPSALPWLWCHK